MTDAPGRNIWSRFSWVLLLGLSLRLLAVVFSEGTQVPDEHFQIIEFASMKLGMTDPAVLPWEYRAAMRPALQPALAFGVIKALRALAITDPFIQVAFLRLIAALLASAALFCLLRVFWDEVGSERLRSWFVWLTSALWFLVFQNVRYSSESVSGSFFFLGLGLYLYLWNKGARSLFLEALAGFILGLSFDVRYQTGFLLAGFGAWIFFARKGKPGFFLLPLIGGFIALGLGVLLDRWFYGRWVPTAWNYFYQNIFMGKAASYGVAPWWFYFKMFTLQAYPPFSLAFIAAFPILFIRRPSSALTWSILPFILVHILISHKEPRFLYPLASAVPAVCVLAAASLPRIETGPSLRWAAILFWALNGILTAIFVFKPAEAHISFYKFIYRGHFTEISTVKFKPYSYRSPQFFYRPAGLVIHEFDSLDGFVSWERKEKRPAVLVVRGFEVPPLPPDLSTKLLFRNMPSWLGRFNYTNWLSRTPAITLCQVGWRG